MINSLIKDLKGVLSKQLLSELVKEIESGSVRSVNYELGINSNVISVEMVLESRVPLKLTISEKY